MQRAAHALGHETLAVRPGSGAQQGHEGGDAEALAQAGDDEADQNHPGIGPPGMEEDAKDALQTRSSLERDRWAHCANRTGQLTSSTSTACRVSQPWRPGCKKQLCPAQLQLNCDKNASADRRMIRSRRTLIDCP